MAAAFIQGDPDGLLAIVLSWVPITAPVAGLMRVAAGSQDVLSIAISVGILAVCVPVALWVSTRVFRIGLLVYGRRLRLSDIFRAVRG